MFTHLWNATIWVFAWFFWICRATTFFLMSLTDWLKGFKMINTWVFGFIIPKLLAVGLGLLLTPFPLWILVALSFLPPYVLFPLYFITIIATLAKF